MRRHNTRNPPPHLLNKCTQTTAETGRKKRNWRKKCMYICKQVWLTDTRNMNIATNAPNHNKNTLMKGKRRRVRERKMRKEIVEGDKRVFALVTFVCESDLLMYKRNENACEKIRSNFFAIMNCLRCLQHCTLLCLLLYRKGFFDLITLKRLFWTEMIKACLY